MIINLQEIQQNFRQHNPSSGYFNEKKEFYKQLILYLYSNQDPTFILGNRKLEMRLPDISQGRISSPDLFGLNELILFAFYDLWVPRRYKKVLDLGANIGLHSIILSGFGAEVTALEPDPSTFAILEENLQSQKFRTSVKIINSAVFTSDNESLPFFRVSQNRTGSHLVGARDSVPYGGFEEINVRTISFKGLLKENFDLVKMDVEGSESDLFESINLQEYPSTDYLLEIGSAKNAERIWDVLCGFGFNGFSQKLGWDKALKLSDLPIHHSDGSFFITKRDTMEWCL